MGRTSNGVSLLFVVIFAVSSLMMAESAFAQSIPSVPEFISAVLSDHSYDVPPTYGIDQYTGKTVVKQEGYHVDNKSVEFTIRNQPFTPYTDSNGNHIGKYYNFRSKGVYGTEWSYYPFAPSGTTTRRYGGFGNPNNVETPELLSASNSEFTTISVEQYYLVMGNISVGGQVEFQVQALVGYMYADDYMLAGHVYVFRGVTSDWSNSRIVTYGQAPNPTSTPSNFTYASTNPSPTPIIPELSLLVVVPLIVGMFFIAVVLRHRKPVLFSKYL
jgi:hypothetical protein